MLLENGFWDCRKEEDLEKRWRSWIYGLQKVLDGFIQDSFCVCCAGTFVSDNEDKGGIRIVAFFPGRNSTAFEHQNIDRKEATNA